MTGWDDPRVSGEFVRCVGGESDVVLVGVVHDHPASRYRVGAITESVEPAGVALELPPLAIPLFERYAESGQTPPAFGGEMTAAIRATEAATVVGIDGPTPEFFVRTLRTLHRERAPLDTVGAVLGGLASVTQHAVRCRIAALVARATGVRVEVEAPIEHDCSPHDDPETQAADEREQVRRAKAVSNAFGVSDARWVRETTRERHMAERLSALREDGDVVAVVGAGHLDAVATLLGERRD